MGRHSTAALLTCATMTFLIWLSACNSGGTGSSGPPPPPSITIKNLGVYYGAQSTLNLRYAIAGQGGFTLLVSGSGFTASSVVEWNGNPLATQFGDANDLATDVAASAIASPGSASITVADAGTSSSAVVLPIASPATATAGVVALISSAPDGSFANGDSLIGPAISATGRYVAFQSNATNLASGPASGYQEIYERDTCVGAPVGCSPSTIRITVTYDNSPVNGHSRDSAISSDGRFVAFDTQATNLVLDSSVCDSGLNNCVFFRDTCLGAPPGCTPSTIPVSVNTQGQISPGSGPQLSPDGRFVAFTSGQADLGLGSSDFADAFVRDLCTGAASSSSCVPGTMLISVPSGGAAANQESGLAVTDSIGRYFAFESWATNMVANEGPIPGIFLRDSCIGAPAGCVPTTTRMDVTNGGGQPNSYASVEPYPAISVDGRLVAFGSGATNLVATSLPASQGNLFVRDTCNGAPSGCTPSTSLISLANDGSIANCGSPGNQGGTSLSASGRLVSFGSIATNLSPDDTNTACSTEDIFVRDTCFGVSSGCTPSTVRVSVGTTPSPGTSGNAASTYSAMSADGHYVAFLSPATNFLPGQSANGHQMVYLAKTGF